MSEPSPAVAPRHEVAFGGHVAASNRAQLAVGCAGGYLGIRQSDNALYARSWGVRAGRVRTDRPNDAGAPPATPIPNGGGGLPDAAAGTAR